MELLPTQWTFDWTMKYVRLFASLLLFLTMLVQVLNDLNKFYT